AVGAGLWLVVVSLALGGIGIGPLLVSQFSLGSMRSPHRRSATVMTMLGSAVMVGQAGAAAVRGWVSGLVGTTAAMWCPIAAAVAALDAAIINWRAATEDESPRPLAAPAARSAAGYGRSSWCIPRRHPRSPHR